MALDRAAGDFLVPAQPRALARAVRHAARAGVFQPADCAASSDRFLRRTPAGVQFQHPREKGARPGQHRPRSRSVVRARHRSARIADQRLGRARPGMAVARRRPAVCRRSRRARARCPDARGSGSAGRSAARSRGSGVLHPRARGDAPGDAALHVASPRVRRETCARRLQAVCRGRRGRLGMDRDSGRTRRARRRSQRRAVWMGQRVPGVRRRRSRVLDRAAQRHERAVRGVRGGRRLRRRTLVAARGLALGAERAASSIRCSGSVRTAAGCGAGCSSGYRCRWHGPCM